MLGLLRRLCSLISHLLFRSAPESSVPPSSGAEEPWTNTEWDGGGDWEPFTVQVIPHDPPLQTQEEQASQPPAPEVDLFSDMQPVFKKPTMVTTILCT